MSTNDKNFNFSPSDLKGHLASTELFRTLDGPILDEIASQVDVIRIPGGDTLFQQGDAGDSLYIVINGRLRVTVTREDQQEEIVAELGRDEMIGEMALLTGENRSASVRAIRDSTLIRLSNEGCYYIAERHPFIVLQIARTLARRLATMNRSPQMTTPLGQSRPSSRFSRNRDFSIRFKIDQRIESNRFRPPFEQPSVG